MDANDMAVKVGVAIEQHGGLEDQQHYVLLVFDPRDGSIGVTSSHKDPVRVGELMMAVGHSLEQGQVTVSGHDTKTGEEVNEH